MNIIFGREHAASLESKYTVLELDTLRIGEDGDTVTAFCVVENVPILDMPKVEKMKELHSNLMVEYRKQNWNYCKQAMEHLKGFWNHEMDTFYDSILGRVNQYKEVPPEEGWDGTVYKAIS
jgi:CobQ-like glutamine amidotransferase family enzyme